MARWGLLLGLGLMPLAFVAFLAGAGREGPVGWAALAAAAFLLFAAVTAVHRFELGPRVP